MPLELHIWGPAFGLPSINAECIAATAYLKSVISIGDWVLVPNHDPSNTSNGDFPYLCDVDVVVSGFDGIVYYIREKYEKSLDESLDRNRNADCTAFKSQVRNTALALVDINLYLSAENNYYITRPAWTAILPWYANYIIPPAKRTAAKERTEHLGLSSLDIDYDVSSPPISRQLLKSSTAIKERYESAKTVGIAGSRLGTGAGTSSMAKMGTGVTTTDGTPLYGMTKPLGSVRDLIAGSGSAALFQLDGLAGACFRFLEMLLVNGKGGQDMGGEAYKDRNKYKRFMLSDNGPSSLDCLVLGYLSLIALPDVRKAYLKDVLQTKYKALHAYVLRIREEVFGQEMVDTTSVITLCYNQRTRNHLANGKISQFDEETENREINEKSFLPWSLTPPQPTLQTIQIAAKSLLYNIPLLNTIFPDVSYSKSSFSSSSSCSSIPNPYTTSATLFTFSTFLVTLAAYATHAILAEKTSASPHFRLSMEESRIRSERWQRQQPQRQQQAQWKFGALGTGLGIGGYRGMDSLSNNSSAASAATHGGGGSCSIDGGNEDEVVVAEIRADVDSSLPSSLN